jgi:hypothetical protein
MVMPKSDTICCGDGTVSLPTTSCVHPCWVDDGPCELVAPLADRVRDRLTAQSPDGVESRFAEAMGRVEDWLPCSDCRRRQEVVAARLPRLGKHERRILLAAPPPGAEGLVIPPPGPGRSADESNRRAIRRLWDVGLVLVGHRAVTVKTKAREWHWYYREWRPVEREYHKRCVWLSPLGAAVVARLRNNLESGKRIRWDQHRAELLSACRRPPEALVETLKTDLQRCRESHMELVSLVCQMGGNRASAMRHLEDANALGLFIQTEN